MRDCCNKNHYDAGPAPYAENIKHMAIHNNNFRTAIWTGCNLQMTLMSIPVCEDIGPEMHEDTDQFIRVEQGFAMAMFGRCKCHLDRSQRLRENDAILVPAGTWHNIINTGNTPLKLSSIYAPPNHPHGTINITKEDAEYSEY